MRTVPTAEVAPAFTIPRGHFQNLQVEIPGYRLPLTTDGHLRLIFVGVGSAFATRNFQTNLIVVKGDTAVFVDVGTLTTQRLRQFGLSPLDIEHIVLTHSHADHVGGIEEVALKWRYQKCFLEGVAPGTLKPNLYCPEVYQHVLWDGTLRGGLGDNEADRHAARLQLRDYFHLHRPAEERGWGRPAYRFVFGQGSGCELKLLMFRTRHVPDSAAGWQDSFWSCGLRIDDRVLYTGDTRLDLDMLERFGAGVELYLHDCQSFPGGVHASYDELKELPPGMRKRMLLMHLDDGMLSGERVPERDGFLGFAQDGMSVVYDLD